MATSGTTALTLTRDNIITEALEICSAIEVGETPDDGSIQSAARKLNILLKAWQGSGIHIWRTQECILFPQIDQARYTLGSGSSDRITGTYVETEVTTAAVVGASTIIVDSVTGIATTYNIGVQLDDGTFQWTTVNGAPSGSTVTLTATLTDSVSIGNIVWVYQTALVRPLKIISARRFNIISEIDVPLFEMDRVEYQELPNKTSSGSPNGFFYDRRGGTNTTGLLYFWPGPTDVDEVIKMTVARPVEMFSAAGNDADVPAEWSMALIWNLANQMAFGYDVPQPKRGEIKQLAAEYLAEANWNEKELVSFQLVPDTGR